MNKKKKLTVTAGSALCALSACLAFAACGGSSGHNVTEIKAKDPTCTEAGNSLYYACTDDGCGKLFSDAEGKNEVSLQDVLTPALGHDPVKVEGEQASCTTDGHSTYYDCSRCDVNFSDAEGTTVISLDEIKVAKFEHDGIKEVAANLPTLEKDGNVYHWHCDLCDKDFTNRNASSEIEDVVIPKLVRQTGLTVNVTVYDENGEEISDTSGITLNLKGGKYADSDTSGVTISSGKLSATALIADDYSFAVDGYYPVHFTVNETDKTYNIKLYKYFHKHTTENDNGRITYDYIDGDLSINYNNVDFNGEIAQVNLVDGKIAGTDYMTEFTLQYKDLTDWSWRERVAIKLGTSSDENKFLGVMFYAVGSEVTVTEVVAADPWLGDGADLGRSPTKITGTKATAISSALRGDGLKLRAVRSGKRLTLDMCIDGNWETVWEKMVDGLGTGVGIKVSAPDCTATVSNIKYFDHEEITETHFGYFYESEGDDKVLYTEGGLETTLDELEIVKLTASVNVVVYNGLREKITVPSGLKLTLTDEYERETVTDATVADGKLSATQFFPGKYNVTALNGYYTIGSLVIDANTTEATLELWQIDDRFTVENNDKRVTAAEVDGDLQISYSVPQGVEAPITTLTNEKITGENYMMEFTLTYKFEDGKSFDWFQRMGVWLGTTSGNFVPCGISLMITDNNTVRVSNLISTDKWLGESSSDAHKSYNVTVEGIGTVAAGTGLKIRVLRMGDRYVASVYVGETWVNIWENTITGLGTGIALASVNTGATATFSGISYSNTYTEATAEKYAYFRMGDKYISDLGEDSTLEGLNVVEITGITVNATVYDGLRKEITDTSALTFTVKSESDRTDYANVTVSDGELSQTAFYPGEYSITIDGYYPVTFTVDRKTKEYTIALYQKDSRFEISNNDGRVTAAEVEEDLQLSFNKIGYNGSIPTVTLTSDKITGTHYLTQFTVKYAFDEGKDWSWMERVAIQLGTSGSDEALVGMTFFSVGDTLLVNEFVTKDVMMGTGNEYGRAPFELKGETATAAAAALKGDGLQIRALRDGDRYTVSLLIGEKWVKIWDKTLPDLGTGLKLVASGPDAAAIFSKIVYTNSYTAETDVKYAYFTLGDKYVTTDGADATEEQLTIQKIEDITVNVEVYNGVGTKIDAPSSLRLTLKDKHGRDTITDATVSEGKLSATAFYPGEYTVEEVDGYYAIDGFTVEFDTDTYTLKLYQIDSRFEVPNRDSRVTAAEVEGDLQISFKLPQGELSPIVTLKNDKLTGENYMAEFTLAYKYDEGAETWNWRQRMGVWLGTTSADFVPCGVSLMIIGNNEVRVSNLVSTDMWLGENANDAHKSYNVTVNGIGTAAAGEGLRIRVLRTGDKYAASVYVGGAWVNIWENTISDLGTGMAFVSVNTGATATFSGISYADAYTEETNEKYAYFTVGDKYVTTEGTDATADELTIKKIEGITVNVTVYDAYRNEITDTSAIRLSFNAKNGRDTITDATVSAGKLSVTEFYPSEYAVTGDYYDASFTVNRKDKTYSITLYQKDSRFTIANNDSHISAAEVDGDLQITARIPFHWEATKIYLTSDKISGTNYMAEFTLKYNFDEGKNWGWTQRVGIMLGTSTESNKVIGVSFFATSDNGMRLSNLVSSDPWLGENGNAGDPHESVDFTLTGFGTALKADGVKFRVTRNGDNYCMRAYIGDQWVKVWEKRAEGLGAGLAIMAVNDDSDAIFSNISYYDSYTAETDMTYGYFKVGDSYIRADGKDITAEEVDKVEIDVTVNVTVYDKEGDGKQAVDAPTAAFSVYGDQAIKTVSDVTISEGKLSATKLYPGKYIIMLDGYLPVTFTVTEDKTSYSIELYPNAKQGNVTVNETTGDITYKNGWKDGVVTTLKDDITGENYMTEFTVKYAFDEGKNWEWTERFSVILGMSPVDEKPIGFMFFMAGDNEIKGANCVSNDIRWFGEGHEGFAPFEKGSADVAAINTALKGDGLQVRAVRNGDKLTVYFLIGDEYKVAWTKTVEGLSSYIGVTAAHNNSTLTVSGISYGTYVEEAAGKQAHLTDGTKVYTLDGVETTDEALAIEQA